MEDASNADDVSCLLLRNLRAIASRVPFQHTNPKHHLGAVIRSPPSCVASSSLVAVADQENVDDLAHVEQQKVVNLVAREVGEDQFADVEFQRRAASRRQIPRLVS